MFNSCAHPLVLDTVDESNSDTRGKVRVFAKIPKVSAMPRCAINIDTGRQKEINAFSPCIPTEFCPHLLGECWVPGGRQRNSTRYGGGGTKVTHSKRSVAILKRGTLSRGTPRVKDPSTPPRRSIFSSRVILLTIASTRDSMSAGVVCAGARVARSRTSTVVLSAKNTREVGLVMLRI